MTDADPDGPQLPDLSSLLGGGSEGMPDISQLFGSVGKMQAVRDQLFEGSAGGGLVRITATGGMAVHAVAIAPEAFDGADADELADLVHAALNDLTERIRVATEEAMGPLGGLFDG